MGRVRNVFEAIDDKLTPKKVKEAEARLGKTQRKRNKDAKPFEAGIAGPQLKAERLAKNKKQKERLDKIKQGAVSKRKKAIGAGAAVGVPVIAGGAAYVLSKDEDDKKKSLAKLKEEAAKRKAKAKNANPARAQSQDPGIEAGKKIRLKEIERAKQYQADQRAKKKAKADAEKAKMKVRSPVGQKVDYYTSGEIRPTSRKSVDAALKEKLPVPKIELSPRPKTETKTKTETKADTKKADTKADTGPAWKNYKSVPAAQNAKTPSKYYMGSDGKKKLAVTKEQLNRKSGETLTQAYNRYEGKTPKKSSGSSSSAKAAAAGDSGKMSFRERRAARLKKRIASDSGSDSRKATQSKRLERVKKRIEDSKKKPVKKMGGGMMKSKMASKGGKMGGKMAGGMKAGGIAKKGYASGGAVKSSKKRSTGVALRGFGAEMR